MATSYLLVLAMSLAAATYALPTETSIQCAASTSRPYVEGTCNLALQERSNLHTANELRISIFDAEGNFVNKNTEGWQTCGGEGCSISSAFHHNLKILPDTLGSNNIKFDLGGQSWTSDNDESESMLGPHHCQASPWIQLPFTHDEDKSRFVHCNFDCHWDHTKDGTPDAWTSSDAYYTSFNTAGQAMTDDPVCS